MGSYAHIVYGRNGPLAEPDICFMSKSLGEILEARGLIRRRDPKVIRIGSSFSPAMKDHFHSYSLLIFDDEPTYMDLCVTWPNPPRRVCLVPETPSGDYPNQKVYTTLDSLVKDLGLTVK